MGALNPLLELLVESEVKQIKSLTDKDQLTKKQKAFLYEAGEVADLGISVAIDNITNLGRLVEGVKEVDGLHGDTIEGLGFLIQSMADDVTSALSILRATQNIEVSDDC